MPHDDKRKPGHRWASEDVREDKGQEFVDPLAGPGTSSGARWIGEEGKTQEPDSSDLRGSDRRGAVLPSTGEVTESSAGKVTTRGQE